MGKRSQNKDIPLVKPEKSPVILLLKDMASTTWRMFVPTLGFAILGVWGDRLLGTEPLIAFVGVLAGAAIAGLLIKRQLTKVSSN